MYGDEDNEALVGKTIVGIDIAQGEEALRFRCADGSTVIWGTYADCCSETWWADGYQLDALRGGTVREVNVIELPEPDDDRSRQEYDSAYGIDIVTDRGVAKFVYRNSSNGYYGGCAELGEEQAHYLPWREIVGSDWRA